VLTFCHRVSFAVSVRPANGTLSRTARFVYGFLELLEAIGSFAVPACGVDD
jgi:hypothetical protein